jgi:phosphatidylglycerophosphatase C
MTQKLQVLAVFDFDHTLAEGDSFWHFLILVAGWSNLLIAVVRALALFIWRHFLHQDDRTRIDRGTFFKQQLLTELIAGRSIDSLREAAVILHHGMRWNSAMRRALQEHYDKGDHIIIASGALDLYLPELVKDAPHQALLCTEIEIRDGRATDVMKLGNCVRQGKADRVAAYIAAHGPFGESWGYGNFPDDIPMLNLLKNRIII